VREESGRFIIAPETVIDEAFASCIRHQLAEDGMTNEEMEQGRKVMIVVNQLD